MSNTKITRAIIGMNGYSTRRLPVAAAFPKDFMPIGNRPAIDYIVDDLVAAGITDIYMVVHPHCEILYTTYFSGYPELDMHLKRGGKTTELEELHRLRSRANFHFIPMSPDPNRYGTAMPLLGALEEIGYEPCVYVSSDDFTVRTDGGSDLADLLKAFETSGADGALLGVPIPVEKLTTFGVLQTEERDGYTHMTGVVEKPKHPEELPEPRLANISKYVFGQKLFKHLENMQPNPDSGEYVIFELFQNVNGEKVIVVPAKGDYYDVGHVENWLEANVKLAS